MEAVMFLGCEMDLALYNKHVDVANPAALMAF